MHAAGLPGSARAMPVGVFRVTVTRSGPEADRVLEVLREHAEVSEVAPDAYDARLHDDMQSGTGASALTYVLDRRVPDWAQHVEMRPTDDP